MGFDFGAFAGGLSTGLQRGQELGLRAKRAQLEDDRARREEEQWQLQKDKAERDAKFERDLEAAGRTETSGIAGVPVGVQQDAQLAGQQAGFGMNRTRSAEDRMGSMRDVALGAGKIREAAALSQMGDQEHGRERKRMMDDENARLFKDYQDGKLDQLGLISGLGETRARYGDDPVADMMRSKQFADTAKNERHWEAVQAWMGGADPKAVAQTWSEKGKKVKDVIETEADSPFGGKQKVLQGTLEDGTPFRIGQHDALFMMGGAQGAAKMLEKKSESAGKNWKETVRGYYDPNAREYVKDTSGKVVMPPDRKLYFGGGAGGGSAGGSPKAVQTMEWKAKAYRNLGIEGNLSDAIAANPQFATTPQAVQRQAQFIIKSTLDPAGQPTKTMEQAMQEARQSMSAAQDIAVQTMGAQPAPSQAAPAAAPAKRLRFDAQGNPIK